MRRTLDQKTINSLKEKVRDLVIWLNQEGFHTIDSGDGSDYLRGMEGAIEEPMVAISVEPHLLISKSNRLVMLLQEMGISISPIGTEFSPTIEASYDPTNGLAVIILTNVLSKDIKN